MNIKTKFETSLKELSSVRSLSLAGMLLALAVVIGYFANFTLAVFPLVKIGFGFLPQSIAAAILGPVASAAVGGLADIISFFINGQNGPYFPGWTFNAIVTGFIYGAFMYKSESLLKNIIAAKIIILLVVEIVMGTAWLNIQFGWPFAETLATRAITNTLSAPIEIALIFIVTTAIKKIVPNIGRHSRI